MELSWLMRFRIAAAFAVGIALIGFFGWPLAGVDEPFTPISLSTGAITFGAAAMLIALAFLCGLLAYFFCWPYGAQIGILAAPAGLAVWTLRSGDMSQLILLNHDFAQRQQLFSTLKWEPLFWLAVVAAGYCGVTLAQRIRPVTRPETQPEKSTNKKNAYVNIVIAFIASVFIAQVSIRLFAQDIKLGSIITQPPTVQIIFAIIVSFGITAFIVKKFLDVSYIWPIIASALVTAFVAIFYTNQSTLQILAERWSAVFFHNSVTSILPIQMVVFGTIGSIWGYWLAVQYNWWRKHGS